jgi:hypothetical protein
MTLALAFVDGPSKIIFLSSSSTNISHSFPFTHFFFLLLFTSQSQKTDLTLSRPRLS